MAASIMIVSSSGASTINLVLGNGNDSCSEWNLGKQGNPEQRDKELAWAAGYVTAWNAVWVGTPIHGEGGVPPVTSLGPIIARIDTYCAAHQKDTVENAISRFTVEHANDLPADD